jgi:glyoxylase-like metal-dependent hydrolase (beta-lactamase superfamily II)
MHQETLTHQADGLTMRSQLCVDPAPGPRAAATAHLQLHKLRGNFTIIEGSGGKIAVLTADGKVFVDAGITATRPRILDAANNLSQDSIKHLINTHWHFDHTDGNQWLNEQGAAILAHENTHKHLLAAQRVEDWEYNFPSPPLAAVPTEIFSSEKTVGLNRSTVRLKYYNPAHTNCDISVTFSEADVFDCGDTYWNGFYPFIDYSIGGSTDGMIKATDANIAGVGSQTIVPPIARCSSPFERMSRSSSGRGARSTRPSPPSQPQHSTRGGASSSSRPPFSRS